MSDQDGFIDFDARRDARIANLRGRIYDYLRERDSIFLKDPRADEFLTYLAESQLRSGVSFDSTRITEKWKTFTGGENQT